MIWFLKIVFPFKTAGCTSSSRWQSRKFFTCKKFSNGKHCVWLLSIEFWLAENEKSFLCVCFFFRFQLIYLQCYRFHFFDQCLSGQFFSVEKTILTYFDICCLHRYPHRSKSAKNATSSVLSLCSSSFSTKTIGFISSNKVSLGSFIVSEGDSEIYLGFGTLHRSADKLIMPTNAKSNDWYDISGKRLKSRFKTLSSIFFKKSKHLAKTMPELASPLVCSLQMLIVKWKNTWKYR